MRTMDKRFKKSENGLIAHIYEHISVNHVENYLLSKGFFDSVDFRSWGSTYDETLGNTFEYYDEKVYEEIKKAYLAFDKTTIPYEDIKWAAKEIAIEYRRPLIKISRSITKEIDKLHQIPWQDIKDLPAIRRTYNTSARTVYSTPNIYYGNENTNYFNRITVKIEIKNTLYKNCLEKKALSALLIQILNMNLIQHLRNRYVLYDNAGSWDNENNTINHKTNFSFLKTNRPSQEDFQKTCDDFLNHLINDGNKEEYSPFVLRVKHLLKEHYKNFENFYFGLRKLSDIADGVLIGPKGWNSVANEKTIKELLLGATISCEYGDNLISGRD